ncbi:MAG TPA: hypothetical protein VGE01_14660 [Fimbriimonas sp.]
MDSHEDVCPWCQRSKTGTGGFTQHGTAVRPRRPNDAYAVVGAVAVLAAIVAIAWVGMRLTSSQLAGPADPSAPLPLSENVFRNVGTATTAPPASTPATFPPTGRGIAARVQRPVTVPSTAPVPQAAGVAEGSSVQIRSAKLSLYDDGSGRPMLRGEVSIANGSPANVRQIVLTVRIGGRPYRLDALGSSEIPRGGSAAIAVTASIPDATLASKEKHIQMQATLEGAAGTVIDEFRAD